MNWKVYIYAMLLIIVISQMWLTAEMIKSQQQVRALQRIVETQTQINESQNNVLIVHTELFGALIEGE